MELRKPPYIFLLMLLLWWERSITMFTTHLVLSTGIGGFVTDLCLRVASALHEAVLHLPRTLAPTNPHLCGPLLIPDPAHINPTETSSSPPGPVAELMSHHNEHHHNGRRGDRREEDYDRRDRDHYNTRSSRNHDGHRRVTRSTKHQNSC